MRIGLVSLHTSPLDPPGRGDSGGMNVVVRALGDELARSGHEVELLTRAVGTADAGRELRLESGALLRFLPAGAGPLTKEELPEVTAVFGEALAALPPFEVLHAHYWLSADAALPAARASGAASVFSPHTLARLKNAHLAEGDAPEPQHRLEAEARLLREADGVIVATEAERMTAGRPDAAVIPPGVDTELFHPAPGSPADPPRGGWRAEPPPYLVVIGRLQPLKGQDLVLRALRALPPQRRPLLFIAGEASGRAGAEYAAALRADAAGLETVFTGALPRTELAALLRGAAAAVIPSHSESFGLVALEAAASGVPVIAGRVPGLRDAVVDGVTGLLVEGREPAAWAAAIERMLRDGEQRAAMAQASVMHARLYSWQNHASRTANLYRKLRTVPLA